VKTLFIIVLLLTVSFISSAFAGPTTLKEAIDIFHTYLPGNRCGVLHTQLLKENLLSKGDIAFVAAVCYSKQMKKSDPNYVKNNPLFHRFGNHIYGAQFIETRPEREAREKKEQEFAEIVKLRESAAKEKKERNKKIALKVAWDNEENKIKEACSSFTQNKITWHGHLEPGHYNPAEPTKNHGRCSCRAGVGDHSTVTGDLSCVRDWTEAERQMSYALIRSCVGLGKRHDPNTDFVRPTPGRPTFSCFCKNGVLPRKSWGGFGGDFKCPTSGQVQVRRRSGVGFVWTDYDTYKNNGLKAVSR